MDFVLSKEQEMARQLFRDFAEKEVKPLAQEVDEEERFPAETVAKMQKFGFMGIPFPKELGGQGCDTLTYAMCVEELSKVCATTGVIVSAHTSLGCDPIKKYGTPEQIEKYLVPMAQGKKLGAFGLTEPGAGTDASGQQTKAVLDGDTVTATAHILHKGKTLHQWHVDIRNGAGDLISSVEVTNFVMNKPK